MIVPIKKVVIALIYNFLELKELINQALTGIIIRLLIKSQWLTIERLKR